MDKIKQQSFVLFRLAMQDRMAFNMLLSNPDIDLRIACFHGQQAIEKLLKVLLVLEGVVFPPTHNLIKLAELLMAQSVAIPVPLERLSKLNPYAVVFRYDDRDIHTITREEAKATVEAVFAWAEAIFS